MTSLYACDEMNCHRNRPENPLPSSSTTTTRSIEQRKIIKQQQWRRVWFEAFLNVNKISRAQTQREYSTRKMMKILYILPFVNCFIHAIHFYAL